METTDSTFPCAVPPTFPTASVAPASSASVVNTMASPSPDVEVAAAPLISAATAISPPSTMATMATMATMPMMPMMPTVAMLTRRVQRN